MCLINKRKLQYLGHVVRNELKYHLLQNRQGKIESRSLRVEEEFNGWQTSANGSVLPPKMFLDVLPIRFEDTDIKTIKNYCLRVSPNVHEYVLNDPTNYGKLKSASKLGFL